MTDNQQLYHPIEVPLAHCKQVKKIQKNTASDIGANHAGADTETVLWSR